MDVHLPFFSYGTLLPGQPNFGLWREAIQSMAPATLAGARLYNLGDFPMLVEGGEGEVLGLVVRLKPDFYHQIVLILDRLEGIVPDPSGEWLFRRVRRVVRSANGEDVVAWVYLGNPAHAAGLEPLDVHWKMYTREW